MSRSNRANLSTKILPFEGSSRAVRGRDGIPVWSWGGEGGGRLNGFNKVLPTELKSWQLQRHLKNDHTYKNLLLMMTSSTCCAASHSIPPEAPIQLNVSLLLPCCTDAPPHSSTPGACNISHLLPGQHKKTIYNLCLINIFINYLLTIDINDM